MTGKEGERSLAVKLRLADSRVQGNEANVEYELTIGEDSLKRTGTYKAGYSLALKDERAVLTQKTLLRFSEPLHMN